MRKMIQVLYSSKTNTDLTMREINHILEVSRRNNSKNNVTGILLYRNGEFLQLLEGDEINVHYTLKKIMDDQRHSDINIFFDKVVERRLFTNWSMAFKTEFDYNPEIDDRLNELKSAPSISGNLSMMSFLNSFFYKKTG